VSFGRMPDGSDQWMFLDDPSPGAANSMDGLISIEVENITGWNLVGLPLITDDAGYQSVFPSSVVGTCYGFDSSYYNEEELQNGNGYWIYFSESGFNEVSGNELTSVTLQLSEGWNLITGISTETDVTSIIDPYSIIVPGTLYSFDGNYTNISSLIPGRGYWLMSYGIGEITISSNSTLSAKTTRETITLLEHANTLTLNNQTLYFGVEIPEDEKLSYSLPPKPPEPSTDVRFYGDTRLCSLDECVIEVLNDGNPLTFEFDIKDGEDWELIPVITNETKWSAAIPLADKNQITLDSEVNQWVLRKSTLTVPNTFTLHPAYPNPFNPITSLRYDLPEQAQVTLTVYDMLGREVTQLINTTQEAGYRSVQWDATDMHGKPVSAGVYLYQIRAGEFAQTKKMVLLK
jgi:hypothetical protein